MITVERRGRLGNQMFQYAFGLAAARRLGTDFAMADDELRAAFTLGRNARLHRRATRAFRYRLGQRQGGYRVVKVAPDTDPAAVVASLVDSTHYAGFFQSETYFANAREEVRQAFTPRGEVEQAFRERYAGLLGTPYVCCHVRRTDYVPPGWALPVGYYEECLRLLEPGDGTPVVFVGDDLVEAERAFGGDDRVRFERNEQLVDLLLLVHARAVVASNSSFAWWGAWLGRAGRPVLAPRGWLGFRSGRELPPDVIPPGWRPVEVPARPADGGSTPAPVRDSGRA